MAAKLTTSEFIIRAKKHHGNKYDYSKTIYENSKTPVTIICPVHGEFTQIPANHVFKHGCSACAGVKKTTPEDFIKKCNEVHNNHYDYSETVYKNARSKITIICPEHGPFSMTGNNHLRGHGCGGCNGGVTKSHQQFIDTAARIHNDKYTYNDPYQRSAKKIKIVCPDHGEFTQTPNDHITGYGCPRCTHVVSPQSQLWLDHIGLPNDIEHREVKGLIESRKYVVDGYDPITKTVYEFHGDYWHGNPRLFNQDEVNPSVGLTYGELYRRTVLKKQDFEAHGYTYVEMWHSDWELK